MKGIKSIVNIIGLIVKYSAIVMAVVKGLQVMYDELKDLKFDEK